MGVHKLARAGSLILLTLIPCLTLANAPNPPRNIRVVPGATGPCIGAIVIEANEAIAHLIENYLLSDEEGLFLYSASVAGATDFLPGDQEVRGRAVDQLIGALSALLTDIDEFETLKAAIAEETGFSDVEATGLALIRITSRNEVGQDERKKALQAFDATVLNLQAVVRGCADRK